MAPQPLLVSTRLRPSWDSCLSGLQAIQLKPLAQVVEYGDSSTGFAVFLGSSSASATRYLQCLVPRCSHQGLGARVRDEAQRETQHLAAVSALLFSRTSTVLALSRWVLLVPRSRGWYLSHPHTATVLRPSSTRRLAIGDGS